ncbi:hypothetical protein DPMN_016160 [Dreissena polymorpha]|uniref:Uncharacterized protein n=1 Tax=Dreissena polymorpha TaxID=45954 RepID=A0A9D4S696_DREPO|nr:hypothetical protein DPMN_016160 [Dreissena polymorpha]
MRATVSYFGNPKPGAGRVVLHFSEGDMIGVTRREGDWLEGVLGNAKVEPVRTTLRGGSDSCPWSRENRWQTKSSVRVSMYGICQMYDDWLPLSECMMTVRVYDDWLPLSECMMTVYGICRVRVYDDWLPLLVRVYDDWLPLSECMMTVRVYDDWLSLSECMMTGYPW